jgi:bifunctional UDP-N-acetylglucosamine pyrophosphorylase/glucosamine-1-phosphate N-acetyltransferase
MIGEIHLVVLAAGKGTRMKSGRPKVLHPVAGVPMINYVLRAAAPLHAASTIIVVGHQAEAVRASLAEQPGLRFAVQEPQLGTGHALLQAEPALSGASGILVLLSGDVPLLRTGTLAHLVDTHGSANAAATVLTAVVDRPYGYGRIIRSDGALAGIVEEKDASPAQRTIREINAGIYAFDLGPLFAALRQLAARNAQGEYYLTDLIGLYRRRGLPLATATLADDRQIRGINSRTELAEVSNIVRQSKNEELMAAGVTLEDPATTYVQADVQVGADTVIHPGVSLEGKTRIGARCEIHAGVRIVNSVIGDEVTVRNFCVIVDSSIATGAIVGPFAHLRPGSQLGEGAHVGNFVELKKAVLGAGSKANHLTYLGDATVGDRVNIGAGTITCNYDGERKHETIIEDGAFIGSDSQLVAPVRVGKGAYVAAGSSITEDVPAGSLAVARSRQINKPDWGARRKKTG